MITKRVEARGRTMSDIRAHAIRGHLQDRWSVGDRRGGLLFIGFGGSGQDFGVNLNH